ncbi:hypothetical protein FGG90_01240 [Clavibacter tessellarius]|uniref:Uncharacterized protein n=1 Tax=Clavibacter tessellarius TaxID=31965 RepID=A0A225CCU5_9MICO|nr:hypothetical protein [Clavibacter michiganensis]OQJ61565.1 hypothetical protein B5P24_00170 [Clavibacter michiganensis subsp. tessellarius]UKF32733.1 hypothetical protein FGG90_01240 [Clavibacter michiganensis subsp. tessellarius]
MRTPSLLGVGLVVVALLAGGVGSVAAPPETASASGRASWLLVADPAAHAVSIVDSATGRTTGSLPDTTLGAHAGVVQLGHGRIAFVDEGGPRLDVVDISSAGVPRLASATPIPSAAGTWTRAGWISDDAGHRYVAVGSDLDGSTTQQVTLVDTRTGRASTAEIRTSEVTLATTGARGTEEMETFLVGSPLRLVVSAGGHLDAYDAADILRGDAHPAPVASTPLGAYPHGPIADARGTVIGSTLHDGVETVPLTRTGFGTATTRAYPERAQQSYRPRMAPDGVTAVGAQAGATAADPALLTSSSMRGAGIASVALGTGTPTRAVVGPSSAAVVVTEGGVDTLDLVARGADGLYDGAVTRVRLPALGQAAGTGSSARFLAASADGSELFLSRAGTGSVLEIDVRGTTATVRGTIAVPSALADGGYLATVDQHQRPYDLSGR